MRRVSTSCASAIGAVTRRIGSSGKNTVPSGMACTSPLKRSVSSEARKCRAEAPGRRQPFQLLGGEVQLLQKFQRLFEPRRQQETAARAQPAHEELEHGGLFHAGVVITLQHGELIEIGQQDAAGEIHAARPSSVMNCAPRLAISASARCPSPGRTSTARIASARTNTS